LRIGVVGTGSFGRNHVRILSSLSGCFLTGVFDARPEVGEAIAEEHGTQAFSSLSELAEASDAAVIAVPTVSHLEVGQELLGRGLHLLVEKPIALDADQARQLVEAAEGRVLAVGHVEFYNPAVQALLGLGLTPGYMEVQRRAGFSPRSLDIDVVLDLMIHDLQIIHALDPSGIAEIRATGIPVLSPRTDIANVRLLFESGMVANLTASRISAERDRKLRAFFQDEYYSMDYEKQQVKGYRLVDSGEGRQIVPANLEIETGEPLKIELQSFAARCQGREAPLADGRQGQQALETALAINRAIEG
jgi:predicted dehydrogenase